MKLQNFISMLTAQLKEEEISYEAAVKAQNFFLADEVMQRIKSLSAAIHKTARHSDENIYVSQVEFQLL